MDDTDVEFIEQFGLMSKEDGLPRIAGRIYGLLLLQEKPLCLDEMADLLQVSKASVSTNARRLERMGVVERTGKPGDRRDYYRASADAIEGNFDRIRSRVGDVLRLLEGIIPRLSEDRAGALERLEKMRDWHAFLLDEMEGLLERWESSRRNPPDDNAGEENSPQ